MSNYHQQPYAPTPYLPTPLPSSSQNLDTEIKLHTTTTERELYESLAEIHAIIVSLEFLEKAFVKDSIPATAYTPTCARLLGQYKTLLADSAVSAAFGDLDEFKLRYSVECPAASRRIAAGVPATTDHPPEPVDTTPQPSTPAPAEPAASDTGTGKWKNVSPKLAAEATQNFITFMDALRLHYRANDELHPLLAPVIASVDAVTRGEVFEGRKDIVKWLIVLNQMKAGEEITEEQQRECLWDVERAYNGFIEGLG
ncbi:vacuolar protein sorting-associated [Geopyxis carbonaria]|nr:vacuolar protein sorting-associated [Geopyxis carbonaria]